MEKPKAYEKQIDVTRSEKLDHVLEAIEEEKKEQEPNVEDLDSRSLGFLSEHIDVSELAKFEPEAELSEIRLKLRQLPREEQSAQRKILMQEFKEKMKEWRKRISFAQTEMEDMLRTNPDGNREELRQSLEKIIQKYSLDSQKINFALALGKFINYRWAIKNTAENYQAKFGDSWEKKLFSDLFDKEPRGQIDIEILPVSLYFKINDLEDYATAFNAGAERESSNARRSGGGRIKNKHFTAVPDLNYKVLIENSSLNDLSSSERIKIHEEEHAIHDFYPKTSFIVEKNTFFEFQFQKGVVDFDQFRKAVKKFAHFFVLGFEESAKSEFLSYLKEGRSAPLITFYLLKGIDEGGPYDYLRIPGNDRFFVQIVMENFRRENLTVIKEDGSSPKGQEVENLALKTINDAWENEYKKEINRASDAVMLLLQTYGSDPENKKKVLRLLSQEPLNKWTRLARILS